MKRPQPGPREDLLKDPKGAEGPNSPATVDVTAPDEEFYLEGVPGSQDPEGVLPKQRETLWCGTTL